jgi:hypothetical protein
MRDPFGWHDVGTAVVDIKKGGRIDDALEAAYPPPVEKRVCAHSQRSSNKPKQSVAAFVIALCGGA